MADFLTEHLILESSKLYEDILCETTEANIASNEQQWQLFYDGASRMAPKEKMVIWLGVVFVSPQNHIISWAHLLIKLCSNNVTKNSTLLVGLTISRKL